MTLLTEGVPNKIIANNPMLPLTEYIKELLFEQDCVVIPDFGGFIANFIKSTYSENSGTFAPPIKRIVFNEVLSFDDGLLSSYIAHRESLNRSEALEFIKGFVADTRKKLSLGETVVFTHLGSFKLNSEQKLMFEPLGQLNYFGESYGLNSLTIGTKALQAIESNLIVVETIPTDSSAEPENTLVLPLNSLNDEKYLAETQVNSSRKWWIAASVTGLLACATAWMLHADQHVRTNSMSSLNPFTPIVEGVSRFYSKSLVWPIASNPQAHADSSIKALFYANAQRDMLLEKLRLAESANEVAVIPSNVEISTKESPKAAAIPTENVSIAPQADILNKPLSRFYVIGGAFESRKNALKLRRKLVAAGYRNAFVIAPNQNEEFYKVAAIGYQSASKAYASTQKVSDLTGATAWVMKRQ